LLNPPTGEFAPATSFREVHLMSFARPLAPRRSKIAPRHWLTAHDTPESLMPHCSARPGPRWLPDEKSNPLGEAANLLKARPATIHRWRPPASVSPGAQTCYMCCLRKAGFDAGWALIASMKPSLDRPCFSRRAKVTALWLAICLPLYVLSTGPVAWATNDAFHSPYLPEEVNLIYLPLAPLAKIGCIHQLHYWWTAIVWDGFPARYTTL
jgi:hypothetical protein